MYANRRNLRVLKEIGVEEHDGDVRFFTGSGNTAVSRIPNASGHYYWNSSFIMAWLWGRYHVPQNAFLDIINNYLRIVNHTNEHTNSQFLSSGLIVSLRTLPEQLGLYWAYCMFYHTTHFLQTLLVAFLRAERDKTDRICDVRSFVSLTLHK